MNIDIASEIYKNAVKNKIKKAKKDLRNNIDNVKGDLHNIMIKHLENGFYGFELMRDPFLWRDECKGIIKEVSDEVETLGHFITMNDKYHTITIIPSIEFSRIVSDCFIGFDNDTQFVQYTIDDKNADNNKKWKSDMREYKEQINEKINILEQKINKLWYAPDMPGYIESFQHFNKEIKDKNDLSLE